MAKATQPEAMSPIGRLVKTAMDERGLSTRDVEAAGGPPASTTGRLINPRIQLRRPPSDDTLSSLARVLRIPEIRIQQAIAETLAWDITDPLRSEQIRNVAAAMARLDEAQQTTIEKIVMLIIDELNISREQPGTSATPPVLATAAGQVLEAAGRAVQGEPEEELPRAARVQTGPTLREQQEQDDQP